MQYWAILAFWIAFSVVVYTYIGYGIVVLILDKLTSHSKIAPNPTIWPEITILIAAYNEASIIKEKIENTCPWTIRRIRFTISLLRMGPPMKLLLLFQPIQRLNFFMNRAEMGKFMQSIGS